MKPGPARRATRATIRAAAPFFTESLACAAAACLLATAACSSPKPSIASAETASSVLEGFDAPEPGSRWRPGDRALLLVELDDHGVRREWLVGCELLGYAPFPGLEQTECPGPEWPEFLRAKGAFTIGLRSEARTVESFIVRVRVTALDADGRAIGTAVARVPELALVRGFHASVARLRPGSRGLTAPVMNEVFADLLPSLIGYLEIFRATPPVEEIRSELASIVVEKPSLGSILSNLGASISLRLAPTSIEARASAGDGLPEALVLPIEVIVNGEVALRYRIVAAPPAPPLVTVAGVVAIEGEHPADPRRRFAVRLVAARRGPERTPASPGGAR